MQISVVIPTYHSSRTLGLCLEKLLAQETTISYEIICVDNSRDDQDERVVASMLRRPAGLKPELKYIRVAEPVFAGIARNIGAKAATGELLVFVDSDVIVPCGYLESIWEYHVTGHDVFTTAVGIYEANGCTLWERLEWMIEFSEFKPQMKEKKLWCMPACSLAIKKQIFDETRFRDIHSSEDVDLVLRIHDKGHVLWFFPGVAAYHWHHITLRQGIKKLFGFGKSNIQLRWDYPVSGSTLARNPVALFFILPLFMAVKFGKVSCRNIRFNSASDTLLYLACFPLSLLVHVAWMCGGYAKLLEAGSRRRLEERSGRKPS